MGGRGAARKRSIQRREDVREVLPQAAGLAIAKLYQMRDTALRSSPRRLGERQRLPPSLYLRLFLSELPPFLLPFQILVVRRWIAVPLHPSPHALRGAGKTARQQQKKPEERTGQLWGTRNTARHRSCLWARPYKRRARTRLPSPLLLPLLLRQGGERGTEPTRTMRSKRDTQMDTHTHTCSYAYKAIHAHIRLCEERGGGRMPVSARVHVRSKQ